MADRIDVVEARRNVRHRSAIVSTADSFSVLTSICHNAKLVANPPWNVKTVQLRMTDRRPVQPLVELLTLSSRRVARIYGSLINIKH